MQAYIYSLDMFYPVMAVALVAGTTIAGDKADAAESFSHRY